MFELGQCILFKVAAKVHGGEMNARWEKGMWLGKMFSSDEHILSTSTGLVARSSAVKAHPDVEFDSQLFDSLIGMPWDPEGKKRGEDQEQRPEGGGDLPRVVIDRGRDAEIPKVRGFEISRDLIEKFGPTETCNKCRALMSGDNSQPALGHSMSCRARIAELMGSDPVLASKLDNEKKRQNEYLARRVEAGDSSAKRVRMVDEDKVEELLPGPGGVSETREESKDEDEPIDGEPMTPETPNSRAPSTVTCVSDLPEDIDMPLPAAARAEGSGSTSMPVKRPHEGPDGDEGRGDQDPDEPEDMEAGFLDQEVYMLGERRWRDRRVQGEVHPGAYDICELFSPHRVSAMANRQGLRGGWSLDLNCEDPVTKSRWDLSDERVQAKVWKLIRKDKPLVIGMSPECTLFSALQNLRKTSIPKEEMERAKNCVRFCVEVAWYQQKKGRCFYLEHPLTASSWRMPEMEELRMAEYVHDVVLHMCRFGLKSTDSTSQGPVKKPTRVITNMESIAGYLNRQCTGDHRHVHLVSGKAKAAAEYTEDFCKAIVSGIAAYLEKRDGDLNGMEFEAQKYEPIDPSDYDYENPFQFDGWGRCVDDVSGADLPMDLVRQGRETEMECFFKRKVYSIRPRAEAVAKGAKILGVRWVDVMKKGKVRSRLVCQDFNTDRGRCDEMFAATPPLVVSRWLTSMAASQGARGPGKMQLMALDFSKAFLYGDVLREIYIELPDEDSRKWCGSVVGLLSKSMYGLRDAPQVWQGVVESMLSQRGFRKVLCTQCTYYHPDLEMYVVAHVDDFLILGVRSDMDDFVKGLVDDGYECTSEILGFREDECSL